MRFNHTFLILLMIFFSTFAFAKKEEKVLDTGLDANDKDLEKIIVYPFFSPLISNYDSEYINRIAAKIVAKQETYFLVISKEIDAQSKLMGVKSLKISVKENFSNSLRLEAMILDNNKKLIVKRVIKEEFTKSEFKRVAEDALLILFGLAEEFEVGVKDRKKNKKDKIDEVFPKVEDKTIDFKKRIMALKQGLKQEFKIIETKQKLDEDKDEEEKKEDEEILKEQVKSGLFELINVGDVYIPRGPNKVPGVYSIFTWYSMGAGASDFVIQDRFGTDEEVQFRTNLTSLLGNIYVEMYPPYFEQHAYFLKIGFMLPILTSEDVEPSATPELDIGFLGAYFSESLYLRIGIRRDSQQFANLPILGGGLEIAEVSVMWAMLSAHYLFWERKLYVKFEQANQLSSDFSGDTFTDGSLEIAKSIGRFGFSTSFIMKGSYIELGAQSTSFRASGQRTIQGVDTSVFSMFQFTF